MKTEVADMPPVIEEKDITGKGIEAVLCFFCGKNPVRLIGGRGRVALGEKADGSEFGTHVHCGCLNR